MKIEKLKQITLEALQARGYSNAESQMFITQLSLNIQEDTDIEEVIPGKGIFCSRAKQLKCMASYKTTLARHERLWEYWMNRTKDLEKVLTTALTKNKLWFNTDKANEKV